MLSMIDVDRIPDEAALTVVSENTALSSLQADFRDHLVQGNSILDIPIPAKP